MVGANFWEGSSQDRVNLGTYWKSNITNKQPVNYYSLTAAFIEIRLIFSKIQAFCKHARLQTQHYIF